MLQDIIDKKLYGDVCPRSPHKHGSEERSLSCFWKTRLVSSIIAGIVCAGLIASLLIDSDFPTAAIAGGAVVAGLVGGTIVYFFQRWYASSNYHHWTDMYDQKVAIYMEAGDDRKRAEVLADNEVSAEFDRRRVAARNNY